jgi:sugar porter (SP) family MFS transporter
MKNRTSYVTMIAIIVALGGFLMGFDASVISGVIGFIETEFELSKLQLGWAVSSLTLTATLAMMTAGPISNRIGRKRTLSIAAVLYSVSAFGSAFAPDYTTLVIARMIGGFGVGVSLIIAPMYIAEIAPPQQRGRMVSFNQLNIVVGLSTAFFTNYLILKWSQSDAPWALNMRFAGNEWRWMLGLEALPAVMYFFALFIVPRSPRWLAMKGKFEDAMAVMRRALGNEESAKELAAIKESLAHDDGKEPNLLNSIGTLFSKELRRVMIIGVAIAAMQQIVGINAVFFYAPMIFGQSGIGTDAAFVQAIFVGLTNLVFTILAMSLIDRLGRRPLLLFGVSGIATAMFILSYAFSSATYTLPEEGLSGLSPDIQTEQLMPITGVTYNSDVAFKGAIRDILGDQTSTALEDSLVQSAIQINPTLVLVAILGFVACFAFSLGPVMWVLFSELFPNQHRAVAISAVGFVNSLVSWLVQQVFPWELDVLGTGTTFLIFGVFAALGWVFCWRMVPETKGKTLEELEIELAG